ncbi:type VII secretion integral membrane protein EccD [Amycolatopsis sp. H20-H5]|uniref:type VII secretion integral membrane protein EccD n=1 Tax=Amycolatopsis sp. H20-H5 TaxID=3046309 RepID=UPI002DC02AD2|nr:type VII secretion integral membrane protein EccD [Amycolatopsis sp. H20-H5]MEC3981938.1 type VII secretion integral membrane protein EccD [Amycolatopsis sp. H20-H5]
MHTIGLVRVTVAAPARRVDLALPERSPIAELLPGLLRHSGEHLADQGVADGGWILRRTDGSVLDGARTLAAQRVMDGEVLNLVPARTDWPELEYDDLVATIAAGAAKASATWTPRHTRWAGLVAGLALALLGVVVVLRAGPPWPGPALWSLAAAAALLTGGVVLARVAGDAGAGAVAAAGALPFAFLGGGLLFAGTRPMLTLGAPQLLAGSAAVLLVAMIGLLGVVDRAAVFAGAATAGLLGVLAAWLGTADTLTGSRAAAIVAGAGLAFSPLLAPLALRLAKVPLPVLPRGTADLLRDDPQPARAAVYATVVRADGLLTGLVTGVAAVAVPCQVLLVRGGSTAELILVCLLTAGFGLRARLYPAVAQRVAMLLACAAGVASLATGPLMADPATLLTVAGPVVLLLGALAALAGLRRSTRDASPYWGRYAELLEVVLVLAIVPVVCAVLGLYAYLRGLAG